MRARRRRTRRPLVCLLLFLSLNASPFLATGVMILTLHRQQRAAQKPPAPLFGQVFVVEAMMRSVTGILRLKGLV
ncbi:hypothetical protein IWX47DRAFT_28908 [Phyllosticta citricarpa]